MHEENLWPGHRSLSGSETPTAMLAAIAARLFGRDWAEPLAAFTGTNIRSCERVRAAAIQGQEDRRALGILAEARRRLAKLAYHAEQPLLERSDEDSSGFDHLHKACMEEDGPLAGPFLMEDVVEVLDVAAEMERALRGVSELLLLVAERPRTKMQAVVENIDDRLEAALAALGWLAVRSTEGEIDVVYQPVGYFGTPRDGGIIKSPPGGSLHLERALPHPDSRTENSPAPALGYFLFNDEFSAEGALTILEGQAEVIGLRQVAGLYGASCFPEEIVLEVKIDPWAEGDAIGRLQRLLMSDVETFGFDVIEIRESELPMIMEPQAKP